MLFYFLHLHLENWFNFDTLVYDDDRMRTKPAPDPYARAFDLLRETGVCVVPGRDFGTADTAGYVRISYANKREKLEEAVKRMEQYLSS